MPGYLLRVSYKLLFILRLLQSTLYNLGLILNITLNMIVYDLISPLVGNDDLAILFCFELIYLIYFSIY